MQRGAKTIQHFASKMDVDYAIGNKYRGDDHVDALGVIGSFKGKKRAIIIDDESATGSSIYNIVKLLKMKNMESNHLVLGFLI